MFQFNPYSPAVDADPFPLYRILREEHPCFWSADANMWVLSRYADIMEALSSWQIYSSAKGNLMDELPQRAGATLGTTDPPRHDRLRALIQYAFTKRNLENISGPVRALVVEQLDELHGAREFDFVNDFVRYSRSSPMEFPSRRGRNTLPLITGCRSTRPASSLPGAATHRRI
jgi:hypothetical protein